jgi:HlyD family secretion protein
MSGIRKKRRGWGFLSIVVVAVVAVGWYARSGAGFGSPASAPISGAAVGRGALRINVVERGNLKAAESVNLTSEVEGRTTILFLIEEGTAVEPGELLCQLDTSQLEERLQGQEISVQNAEAAFVKAKQNHAIQLSSNASDIARAERELEFARMDLDKYVNGDWKQDLEGAKESIYLAEQELTQAEQDYEWSLKLKEKGFLEALQLESDRLSMERSRIKLAQARRALELLENYEYKRRHTEFTANVLEAERELERTHLQAKARIVDFEADVRTSEARYELEKSELARLKSQIEKAIIKAPVAGMVVYAREQRGRMGGGEPIQEGTEIRERQDIITIPSADGMIVEASLHESVLEKVKVGLSCLISVDAIPGRSFPGRVTFKAVLPDQNSWWANPDLRVYRTEVEVLDVDERMRPGMSCSLEILVEEIPDTLYIPLQSVFLNGGEPVCFTSDNGAIEMRSIDVGQNNGRWVQVRSGIEEGVRVLLSMPAGFDLLPAPERVDERPPGSAEMDPQPPARAPSGSPVAGGDSRGEGGGPAEEASHGAPPAEGGAGKDAERGGQPRFDRAAIEAMTEEERAAFREEMRKRRGGGGGQRGGRAPGGGSGSPSDAPSDTPSDTPSHQPSDSE